MRHSTWGFTARTVLRDGSSVSRYIGRTGTTGKWVASRGIGTILGAPTIPRAIVGEGRHYRFGIESDNWRQQGQKSDEVLGIHGMQKCDCSTSLVYAMGCEPRSEQTSWFAEEREKKRRLAPVNGLICFVTSGRLRCQAFSVKERKSDGESVWGGKRRTGKLDVA